MKKTHNYLLVLLVLFSVLVGNQVRAESCDEIIKEVLDDNSFNAVLTRTEKKLNKALKEEPLPITSDISARRKQKWTGLEAPEALKPFLTKDVKFLKTPDPNTESPYLAMRKHPGTSALLHVDLEFQGEHTSTKVFMAKPVKTSSDTPPDGEYLIGPEFESVVWHIHGGGTPSAVAGNASSKANYYVKRGIPVLAVDQPGHGNGPSFPFKSDEEIHDWNYELMKKLIHPDVKIHLHGHSWGGMKTTRVWQNSENKYERIVAFQAESPGADLSLGKGGPREKAKLEKEVNDSIDDWEHRAAPSDVEFTKNVVLNRKMSPVAQEYTFLTDIFYRWQQLSPEEIGRRKRINVLVGTYDGLVYVGRENIYDEYYSKVAGENYHKFTRGKTFRGNDIEQGHQIFDLVDESGDFVAYRIGVDLVHEISGQDIAVREIEGSIEDPTSILNKYFNHWANNFAFREYIDQHVEYIEVYNRKHYELIKRSNQLKAYLSNVQKLQTDYNANKNRILEEGIRKYSKKHDAPFQKEKAIQELAIEKSAERTQELEEFVKLARATEKETMKNYHDPIHEVALAKLTEQVDAVLGEGVGNNVVLYESLIEAQRNINNLSRKLETLDPSSPHAKQTSETIQRIFNGLDIAQENKNIDYITAKISEIRKAPEGKKQWAKQFDKALQDYRKLNKEYRKRIGDAVSNAVADLPKPAGIERKADAEWELGVKLTEERVANLKAYISGYDDEVARIEKEMLDKLNKDIAAVEKPDEFSTIEAAEKELELLTKVLKKRFIPDSSDPEFEKIQKIVQKLEDLDFHLNGRNPKSTMAKMNATAKEAEKLKNERTKTVKRLDSLLEMATPSEKLTKAMENYDNHLQVLIDVNTRYAELQEQFYLELFEKGQLTRENVANVPEHMQEMAKQYEKALADADSAEARLSRVRLIEARQGKLVSQKDPDGSQLKGLLNKLLGEYVPGAEPNAFSSESLEGNIQYLTALHAELESKVFKLKEKSYQLERAYQTMFLNNDHGNTGFSEIHAINIRDMLNTPYNELIEQMTGKDGRIMRHAFKKTLTYWEEMWSRMNIEDNYKKTDLYEL